MANQLFEYTRLLREYGDPQARQVQEFVEKHTKDHVFLDRAQKLNALFLLKEALEPEDVGVGTDSE